MELDQMSVHALLEKVEKLDVQLSDERMRSRDLEILCHDRRRLWEDAEQRLRSCELQLKQCNQDRAELQRAVDRQGAEEKTVAAKIELVREGAIALRNEHDAALARIARQDTELERVRSALGRHDLAELAEALEQDCYEQSVNVGPAGGTDQDVLLSTATAVAARIFRELEATLASPAAESVKMAKCDDCRWSGKWDDCVQDKFEVAHCTERTCPKCGGIAKPAPVAQSEEWTKHEVNVAFDPWTGEMEFLPIPDIDRDAQPEQEDAR